jgi:hypothetical protein
VCASLDSLYQTGHSLFSEAVWVLEHSLRLQRLDSMVISNMIVDSSCTPVARIVIEHREYLNGCGDGQLSCRDMQQQPASGECAS